MNFLEDIVSQYQDSFDMMYEAEDIIEQWQKRYPEHKAALYDTFMLAMPTRSEMQSNRTLWRDHFAELLKRVVDGSDLAMATDAELLCIWSDVSLAVPPHAGKFTMYWRIFKRIFPGHSAEIATDAPLHDYETYPGWVDEQYATIRRKFQIPRHTPDPQRWHNLQKHQKSTHVQLGMAI